jgi:site-specific DNA recombinase
LFEAAKKQLDVNSKKATRNKKRDYLLNGHVYCRHCGRAYYAYFNSKYVKGKRYEKRRYRCSGTLRIVEPINPCHNKSWAADTLELLVWSQIERVLDNPELIICEIEKQRQDANQLGVLEAELQQVERQRRTLDRDQEQLLQWALKGFPEETVVTENKRINEKRNSLLTQKAELEAQIKASQEASVSLPKLRRFVELLRQKLTTLEFETKRLALDMLNIKVWLDGHNVEITGIIPINDDVTVTTQSCWC